jgi:hypothetical protein
MKDEEMGKACGTYGEVHTCCWQKNLEEGNVDGRILLKWILK